MCGHIIVLRCFRGTHVDGCSGQFKIKCYGYRPMRVWIDGIVSSSDFRFSSPLPAVALSPGETDVEDA